jgi:hypothetical protein
MSTVTSSRCALVPHKRNDSSDREQDLELESFHRRNKGEKARTG